MLCCFTVYGALMGDVRSTTGELHFKSQSENIDMTLNASGLGLGTSTPSANLDVQGNALISQQLNIGGHSGSSNLNLQGTLSIAPLSLTGSTTSYDLNAYSVVMANTSSDNVKVKLPAANTAPGRTVQIKKTHANNSVIVQTVDTIDNYDVLRLGAGGNLASAKFVSSGSKWYLLASQGGHEGYDVHSSNLIAHYRLDETTGSVAYDSIGQAHGNLTGGFNFSGNGVEGKVGRGLSFDGTDDVITIPDQDSISTNSDQLTITAWVKLNLPGASTYSILRKSHEYLFDIDSSKKFSGRVFTHQGGSSWSWSSYITTGTTLTHQEWTFVCLTYDGTTVRNFLNAVQKASAANTNAITNNSHPMYIGSTGSSSYTSGVIDDIRIYNRAFDITELQAMYEFYR